MYKCPDCTNEYDKLISLSLHYRKGHKKTAKELAISLNHRGQEPVCKCGCGQLVKFLDVSRGFSEFVLGHAARVPGKNNWGNNAKAKEKSLKTRKEMIKSGEWKPFSEKSTGEHWAKGKTKETDPRIAQQVSTRETPEYKKISSRRMSEARNSGIIPTLSGPASSQWKGGISPLNIYCRSSKELYEMWKYPKLLTAKFQCQTCLRPGPELEVHHDKETFSEILRKCAKQHNWIDLLGSTLSPDKPESQILKEKISKAVTSYHIENNVSGIVLCKVCHSRLHNK